MTSTIYSTGGSGIVMQTITVYKNESGAYVTVIIETLVNDKPVNTSTMHIPRDKFRGLVTDVL